MSKLMMNSQAPPHFAHPGQQLTPPGATSSSSSTCTLLVRHLPEAIPFDTLSRLFSHYGADSVRQCTHGRVRNCAFVDFKNEGLAYQAQRQMNGLQFLGKVLSVERASKGINDNKPQQSEPQVGKNSDTLSKDPTLSINKGEGPKIDSSSSSEPISERLGVDYPFPPHLEYAYPPPDGNILTNIVNSLIAVPRFYTQVLHLMNKMNIPAPFCMALPTPPLPTQVAVPPPPPPENISSSESEMESSDEEAPGATSRKAKRMKREVIVGPAVDKAVAHEAVGLKPVGLLPKEIPIIKKKTTVLQINIAPRQIQIQNEEKKEDIAEIIEEESEKESSDEKPFATLEELKSGRVPPEEILSLPMFKNYTPGNPTPVLYIKNLGRDVVADDFYYLFGAIFGSVDLVKSSINVKLMQEGRMRGQAFITFPSIELAQSALNLVNGYEFKGKPVVIQFGRQSKTN